MVLIGLGILISSANTTGQHPLQAWWLLGHSKSISTAMTLIGIGMSAALLVIMWNAQTLNRQWLRVAELALKGVAFFVLVILPYVLWSQHVKQQSEETDLQRRESGIEQKHAKQQKDAEQRVTDLLHQMIELRTMPEGRRQAVAVLRPTLRNPSLASLALAQAVYTIALTDSDTKVREEAWDVLFPNEPPLESSDVSTGLNFRDFVDCLMSYLRKRPAPPVDLIPYKVYVTILMNDRDNVDIRILSEIEQMKAKNLKNDELVKFSKATANPVYQSAPIEEIKNQLIGLSTMKPQPSTTGQDGSTSNQTSPNAGTAKIRENNASVRLDARVLNSHSFTETASRGPGFILPNATWVPAPLAPPPAPPAPPAEVVVSGASRAQAPVLKSLADMDVMSMIKALQSLSPEQRLSLPPHVEIYEISNSAQVSEAVELARKSFIAAGFIVPKAQTKRGRSPDFSAGSIAPERPEVRYFNLPASPSNQRANALKLRDLLTKQKFADVRLDPGNPSENDRSFYGDGALHMHFEVWIPAKPVETDPPAPIPDEASTPH